MNDLQQLSFDLVAAEKSAYEQLSDYLRGLLDSYLETLKPSTKNVYKSVLAHFLNKINNNNSLVLVQYNLDKWEAFVDECYQDIAASTIRVKAHAVKSFFDYLIAEGKIRRSNNPLAGYKAPKDNEKKSNRITLSWDQIKLLKGLENEKHYNVFSAAYYDKASLDSVVEQFGYDRSTIDLYVKQMGKSVGIERLKYSDITEAHKQYFRVCPVTGIELEMIEENWIVKDGLIQAKEDTNECSDSTKIYQ
jgi:hypothetical protein